MNIENLLAHTHTQRGENHEKSKTDTPKYPEPLWLQNDILLSVENRHDFSKPQPPVKAKRHKYKNFPSSDLLLATLNRGQFFAGVAGRDAAATNPGVQHAALRSIQSPLCVLLVNIHQYPLMKKLATKSHLTTLKQCWRLTCAHKSGSVVHAGF